MEGGPQGGYPLFSPRYVAWQKGRVFVVTFISYMSFHLQKNVSLIPSRKRAPPSLHRKAHDSHANGRGGVAARTRADPISPGNRVLRC